MGGYAITESIVSGRECHRIAEAIGSAPAIRTRAGVRHLMSNPHVAELANSPHLISLARAWLGGAACPFRATLFEKTAEANWLIPWHQDRALPFAHAFKRPGWGPWTKKAGVAYAHAPAWALDRIVALRIHLDECGADNGPLKVIPGSHVHGVLSDSAVLDRVSRGPAVECLTPRGGVLAIRPLIIHASSKAVCGTPRRVLHIEYAASLHLARGIRLAVV